MKIKVELTDRDQVLLAAALDAYIVKAMRTVVTGMHKKDVKLLVDIAECAGDLRARVAPKEPPDPSLYREAKK